MHLLDADGKGIIPAARLPTFRLNVTEHRSAPAQLVPPSTITRYFLAWLRLRTPPARRHLGSLHIPFIPLRQMLSESVTG